MPKPGTTTPPGTSTLARAAPHRGGIIPTRARITSSLCHTKTTSKEPHPETNTHGTQTPPHASAPRQGNQTNLALTIQHAVEFSKNGSCHQTPSPVPSGLSLHCSRPYQTHSTGITSRISGPTPAHAFVRAVSVERLCHRTRAGRGMQIRGPLPGPCSRRAGVGN